MLVPLLQLVLVLVLLVLLMLLLLSQRGNMHGNMGPGWPRLILGWRMCTRPCQ